MFSVLARSNPQFDRIATKATFFSAGFITAAWAAIIPFIKAQVGINDAVMGLMLLCLGGGALVGMPIAGYFTNKYGCKAVLLAAVSAFALLYPVLIVADTLPLLTLTLIFFGMSIGITDCAMNIQAVAVEKDAEQPLMSGFHGFYSLGGMFGALTLTLLMSMNVPTLAACIVATIFVLLLLLTTESGLRSDKAGEQSQMFAMPRGTVFFIGIVCFVFFLAEGTVLDWSGIFLTEYRDVSTASAGLAVACFSVAMTFGRLLGDKAVVLFGARFMVVGGALLAMFGFILSLSIEHWLVALVGYTCIGLGCSNVVPIMFSATGKQQVMPESVAVTAVSTLGYVGVLAGPALVGFGAQAFGLPTALFFVVVLILLATLLSYKIKTN
ncbi:MFS transporter [Catenovulum sp. SX2]|uniref:MFS transporter n=1 Tax=Catenovulum sp. SX2 TaxID=3398614 RepID=UPI003F85ECCB